MQLKNRTIAAALFLLWALALTRAEPVQTPATQPPPAQTPPAQAPQEPPAGRGAGRGTQPGTFPAQQRPPGDPALIERGKGVYSASCTACHGADLRGGQLGGPNLLRSLVVLNDQAGELLLPIVRGSRAERGMPPLPIPDDDVRAVAEYIHAVLATSGRQGGPPGIAAPPPTSSSANRPQARSTSRRSAARAIRRPAICRASPPGSPMRKRCRRHGSRAEPWAVVAAAPGRSAACANR